MRNFGIRKILDTQDEIRDWYCYSIPYQIQILNGERYHIEKVKYWITVLLRFKMSIKLTYLLSGHLPMKAVC